MEQQLKQRLIGVTIVVALVVIFVPMLFDQSGEHNAGAPDGIPPIPDEVVEKKPIELPKSAEDMAPKEAETVPESGYKIIPLTDEAPAGSKQKPAGKANPIAADAEPMGEREEGPAEEEEVPVPEEGAADEVEAAPSPKVAKADKQGSVHDAKKPKMPPPATAPTQVQPRKVDSLPAKPGAAAKTEVAPGTPKKSAKTAAVETPAPKPASPALQTAKLQDAATVPPAVAPKPAAEVSNVPSAWAVQTGSFTTEAKAVALTEKLRQAKYPAFVERVQGDSGTIYRVKVGPELERGRAEQIQKQIEGNVGIKGIIVPQR